ncbi:MAG: 2'-5' RNA ligase family protein [Clostridiaceae bacterium]
MDRYVIVCLLKGEVLKFHEKLVEEVCFNYKVRRQKLPAHFTIKAPFETENIKEIEYVLDGFARNKSKQLLEISGFNHFRDAVIFMNVLPSKEAIDIHDQFIDELTNIPWLHWKPHEGKEKVYHCTIVSRLKSDKFSPIWNHVNKYNPQFKTYFDNISILKWNGERWDVYKEYFLN